MLSRRELIAGAAPAILRGTGKRPNVLWLLTDEQRPDSLACYRSPWAHSPHVDELAASGALFENAYVPSPVCVPCRCSLLTGLAASSTGVLHNQAKLGPGTRFLTWRFEDAGYATASFGKKHYFFNGRQAFQTEGGSPTEGIVEPERYGREYNEAEHDVLKYSQAEAQKQTRRWILAGQFPAPEEQSAEARNVALAGEWLGARDKSKPFFLRLSLNAPHTPVVVPKSYLRLIDPDKIAIDLPTDEELAAQPERERLLLRRFQGSATLRREQLRKAWHYYYARAAFADATMGRLLETLRKGGLLDDTIVVMTSDHGTHLGDHGLVQKQTFYDQVASVPYVFRWKDRIRAGARFRAPVGTVGLLPTLLELAGLPAAGFAGASIASSLTGGSEPRREPVFSEIAFGYQGWRDQDRQVMVRDGNLKLTLFYPSDKPDGSLYDLAKDPGEKVNRFRDPSYAAAVKRLTAAIAAWDRARPRA